MDEKNTIDEMKLLNAYIRQNQKRILSNKFSFPAFFLGGTYLIYRKIYFIGIITYTIHLLLFYIIKQPAIVFGIYVLIYFILGLNFNKLYINRAKKTIIRISKSSPSHLIYGNVVKTGGTSIAFAIIIPLVIYILLSNVLNNYYNF